MKSGGEIMEVGTFFQGFFTPSALADAIQEEAFGTHLDEALSIIEAAMATEENTLEVLMNQYRSALDPVVRRNFVQLIGQWIRLNQMDIQKTLGRVDWKPFLRKTNLFADKKRLLDSARTILFRNRETWAPTFVGESAGPRTDSLQTKPPWPTTTVPLFHDSRKQEPDSMKAIGEIIKRLRLKNGWTQKQLAEKLQGLFSARLLEKMEKGEYKGSQFYSELEKIFSLQKGYFNILLLCGYYIYRAGLYRTYEIEVVHLSIRRGSYHRFDTVGIVFGAGADFDIFVSPDGKIYVLHFYPEEEDD